MGWGALGDPASGSPLGPVSPVQATELVLEGHGGGFKFGGAQFEGGYIVKAEKGAGDLSNKPREGSFLFRIGHKESLFGSGDAHIEQAALTDHLFFRFSGRKDIVVEIHEKDDVPFEAFTAMDGGEGDMASLRLGRWATIRIRTEHVGHSLAMKALFQTIQVGIVTGEDGEGEGRVLSLTLFKRVDDPVVLVGSSEEIVDLGDASSWRMGNHSFLEGKCGDKAHDRVGDGDNGLRGSIVPTQLVVLYTGDTFVKAEDKIHGGASPGIDVLGVIPYNGDRSSGVTKAFEDGPLNLVHILEFIHNDRSKGFDPSLGVTGLKPGVQSVGEFIHEGLVSEKGGGVLFEELMGEGMEGAGIEGAWSQEAMNTMDHFLGGGSTKGYQEDATGIDAVLFDEISDARGNGGRFSRAGRGQDALILIDWTNHDGVLIFIECNGPV